MSWQFHTRRQTLINRRFGGHQFLPGRSKIDKQFSASSRIEPRLSDHAARNDAATTTALSGSLVLLLAVGSVTSNYIWILYDLLWVIPRRLNFIHRRFGTLGLFHLHRQVGIRTCLWRWNRQRSETSAYKVRRRGIPQEEAFRTRRKFEIKITFGSYVTFFTDVFAT